MTCKVKVENGAIRLPRWGGSAVDHSDSAANGSFADRYAAYIGAADDLPADLAQNLDHYVHGHRRKNGTSNGALPLP